jgi:hypothetical protein
LVRTQISLKPADLLFEQFPGKMYPALDSSQGFMKVS